MHNLSKEYETTPTPFDLLEDRQEVMTSTGAKATILHYGSKFDDTHNKRMILVEDTGATILPEPAIRALNLEFYKKLPPEEYVIVWSSGVTLVAPRTLQAARAELDQAFDTGIICRLVPVDEEGEDS